MPTDTAQTTVLVISGESTDSDAIVRALGSERTTGLPRFVAVERPLRPADGLARLAAGGVDVLLVDIVGSPEEALDTLVRARIEAPEIPVVILTDAETHQRIEVQALDAGVQDVLTRDELAPGVLPRVLRYAIERQRLQATLQQLSLSDELTGLYNRRGFVALSEHHLKLVQRTRGLLLARIDVCALRTINDRFGRDEGDRALVGVANVLRATFRASDVIARLAGDDFAVLMLDAGDDAAAAVTARLQLRLDQYNAEHVDAGYTLALSMDIMRVVPEDTAAAEELLARVKDARVGIRD
ncbi:MAG: diguanylate cyclase [Gemmatimonadaceae bacterium]|nr:diguanylate cyclase [Gemmatimonadaceae bacterium]